MLHAIHRVVHHSENVALCPESVTSGLRLGEFSAQSGIRFARKRLTGNRSPKDQARYKVERLFREEMSSASHRGGFLTMPGLHWDLEKSLIGFARQEKLRPPIFKCVEHDPAIFTAALSTAPKEKCRPLSWYAMTPTALRSHYVNRYELASAEVFALERKKRMEGAWLDFCGPLSLKRLNAAVYLRGRASVLALTFMKGRYGSEFGDLVKEHGGVINAVTNSISDPLDVLEYGDGAKMVQMIWKTK